MTPRKRCGKLTIHGQHEWYEDNVFRRDCPGRKTTHLSVRAKKGLRGNGNGGNAH